ncbi:MAG TPA: response regulator transcription factor [Methylotenera sp.]|nr:response regulator transcription factor [Methylotenera sp.]HPH04850.1 response regulator transcription factor [Methylotenera sp.]HPN01414.1 response regulator transcription factor [Methylotenera sp.]
MCILETVKKAKIAFLEDDVHYAAQIIEWLKQANYEVGHFITGMDFLKNFSDAQYDLCIFDCSLPDISGADVMGSIKLRSNKLPPIIFLTGHNKEEEDIVRMMESGADDYLIKPVSRPILLVRINALLRRSSPDLCDDNFSEFGALKVDTKQRKVSIDGADIKLTDKEFDLAVYFLRNEGALLSRVHLMQVVWGSSAEVETRKVDVHVSHLRTKLKLTPEYGWKLTSIYQQGYRLERSQ